MDEWSRFWKVVKPGNGPPETWETVNIMGQTVFHIHDAQTILRMHRLGKPWKILHYMGNYEPEEWLGNPQHYVNANRPRVPQPDDFTKLHYTVIPK